MTDHYKISLEILHQLLKESGNDHWAKWIEEDLYLWTTQKRVDHHLKAYGGMGSINDIFIDNPSSIGMWQNKLFDITKNLACTLAHQKISTAPADEKFYRYGPDDISGWRCRNCGHARIPQLNIEHYLSTMFMPAFFVEYIREDKLIELLDLEKIMTKEEITKKRGALGTLVRNAGMTLTRGSTWLHNCPECNSKDVCVYRWRTTDNDTRIIESQHNLALRPSHTPE